MTPQQRRVLRGWMDGAREAYNALLSAHLDGTVQELNWKAADLLMANRAVWQSKDTPKDIPCSVLRNAMMDFVSAESANRTKQRRRPSHHRTWVYRFRRRDTGNSEAIRLNAVKFKPTDPDHVGTPKDTGPVRFVAAHPDVGRGGGGRRTAAIHMGSGMKTMGPVLVRDRAWLIDRLVADHYLRHEARLVWDKRLDVYYLCVVLDVRRPPAPAPSQPRLVSLDPGVRSFQTFCDPTDGTHGVLLDGYQNGGSVMDELKRRVGRIR